jgi:predicted RNA-binding Zn-ribbon protein involved in translation (DUF1610 family)
MTESGQCANGGATLLPSQSADSRYCATCAAAYWREASARKQPAAVEDGATLADGDQCANCGTPLTPDQHAENRYCAKCTAAWQQGRTARQ